MKRILILLSTILFSVLSSNATHVLGGEFWHESIGDPTENVFILKAKVYYGCDGHAIDHSLGLISQGINNSDQSMNTDVDLYFVNEEKYDYLCPSERDNCEDHDSEFPGILIVEYQSEETEFLPGDWEFELSRLKTRRLFTND